jgi:hypothetical protein
LSQKPDAKNVGKRAAHRLAAGEPVQIDGVWGGNEAEYPAETCRDAHGTHDVVADIHVAQAERHGACAATAASAARKIQKNGMVRAAVNGVIRLHVHGAGRHVGFAQDQRAFRPEPGYGVAVRRGHVVFESGKARGRFEAPYVQVVLYGHHRPGQPQGPPFGQLPVDFPRRPDALVRVAFPPPRLRGGFPLRAAQVFAVPRPLRSDRRPRPGRYGASFGYP